MYDKGSLYPMAAMGCESCSHLGGEGEEGRLRG